MFDKPLIYTVVAGTRPDTTIVKLDGPLTLANLFAFQSEIRTIKSSLTIFDLTASEYMDSAGLGVLVNFYVSAEKSGRKMALVGVSARIAALLEMTHVHSLLRVFPSAEEAEAASA